jgi:hypothetical protein
LQIKIDALDRIGVTIFLGQVNGFDHVDSFIIA